MGVFLIDGMMHLAGHLNMPHVALYMSPKHGGNPQVGYPSQIGIINPTAEQVEEAIAYTDQILKINKPIEIEVL
jgi:hypothetical protein